MDATSSPGAGAGTPAWRTGAFAGEFGDAFISDTELEGGQVAPSIEILVGVVRDVLETRRAELTLFGNSQADKIARICTDLLDAAERDRAVGGIGPASRSGGLNNDAFAVLLETFVKRLAALTPGQRVVVSGGWAKKSGGHAVMHVVEREVGGTYAFVTCNTGDGLQYHPTHGGSYPKEKQKTAMRFGAIPPERALEPSLWYMFFRQKVTRNVENSPEMLYEVMLPFLRGAGAYQDAVDRDIATSGHWESIQRAGTCYFRCILCTMRYLMKNDGFSPLQQKQLFVQIRAGFMDQVERDLESGLGEGGGGGADHDDSPMAFAVRRDFRDSDARMIKMGAHQTLFAALKLNKRGAKMNLENEPSQQAEVHAGEAAVSRSSSSSSSSSASTGDAAADNPGITAAGLQRLEEQMARILTLVDRVDKIDLASDALPALRMETSAPLLPFAGFELIAEQRDPEVFAGGETEATPDLFVDLTSFGTPQNLVEFSAVVRKTVVRCDRLRAKTSVSAATIALHQITALVERTFLELLPPPPPRGICPSQAKGNEMWGSFALTLKQQRETLADLLSLSKHYISAARSLNTDRFDDATRTITMTSLFVSFDAIARLFALPDTSGDGDLGGSAKRNDGNDTPVDIGGGRSLLSILLAQGSAIEGASSDMVGMISSPSPMGNVNDIYEASPAASPAGANNNGNSRPSGDRQADWYFESNPAGTIGVAIDSFGGISLKEASERFLIADPCVALMRHELLAYLDSLPQKGRRRSTSSSPASSSNLNPPSTVFAFKMQRGGMMQRTAIMVGLQEGDETLSMVQELRKALGKENELPPVNLSESFGKQIRRGAGGMAVSNPDAMTEIEQQTRWFASTWEGSCPEFAWYRDIHMLFRVGLESGAQWAALNEGIMPALSYTSHYAPEFYFTRANPDGKVAEFGMALGDKAFKWAASADESWNSVSPADIARYVPPSSPAGGAGTTEEDILHHEDLPTFDNALSPEEAESFLTYLTARHIAPPLILRFFSGDRIGQLMNPKLQRIVESVLFEPLEFLSQGAVKNGLILQRVPTRDRRELGTAYGVAMAEALHTPNAILCPLLDICRSAADKCIGDYSSSFVDLLLFCLRLTVRFQGMCRHFRKTALASMRDLDRFLNTVAAPLLQIWAEEAFAHGKVSRQLQIHAHLSMIHAPRSSPDKDVEVAASTSAATAVETSLLRAFLCSSSYVVCWHSKSENDDDEDNQDQGSEKAKTPEQIRLEQMMAMMGGGPGMMGMMNMGRKTRGSGKLSVDDLPTSHRTPTHAVFALIESSRKTVMDWVRRVPPAALDSVLETVFCVGNNKEPLVDFADVRYSSGVGALAPVTVSLPTPKLRPQDASDQLAGSANRRGDVDDWHGWQPADVKPLVCRQVIESAHPYSPSTDTFQTIHFPGAKKISLYFDQMSATESIYDYVVIYKDESCTEHWGKRKKYMGSSGSTDWPGAGGRPPLVIPADSFHLHFHSDASQQDWGFRVEAVAPVNMDFARALLKELEQERCQGPAADGSSIRLALHSCQRALAECLNDLDRARQYLETHTSELLEEERVKAEEKAAINKAMASGKIADARSGSRGLFQDPVGGVRINLQTSEIYFRDRMLMPVPADIASHPDFLQVFGPRGAPYCAIVSNTDHRRWLQIIHQNHTYQIRGWKPLRPVGGDGSRGSVGGDEGVSADVAAAAATSVATAKTDSAGPSLRVLEEEDVDEDIVDGSMQAWNLPTKGRDGGTGIAYLSYRNRRYIPYQKGDAGWFSEVFDNSIDEFLKRCYSREEGGGDRRGQNSDAGNDEEPDMEMWIESNTFSSDDNFRSIVFFAKANGEYEQTKGHPGCWFEAHAIPSSGSSASMSFGRVDVFVLVESARRMQRRLVWSSDSRLSLKDLQISGAERDKPRASLMRFSAGNPFGGFLTEFGKLESRAGAGTMFNVDIYSLRIERTRWLGEGSGWNPSESVEHEHSVKETELANVGVSIDEKQRGLEIGEGDTEVFVPAQSLDGLVPQALLEKYAFWQTGPQTLRGYLQTPHGIPNGYFNRESILIKIANTNDGGATDIPIRAASVATIMRLKRGGARELTLMNIDPSSVLPGGILEKGIVPGGLRTLSVASDVSSSVGVLVRLRDLFCRIDNLSHVLLWTKSDASVGDYCELSRIELPRLNACFSLKGNTLASMDHDGLIISDSPPQHVLRHLKGVRRSLVLENHNGEFFFMCPNFRVMPVKVKACPFSTEVCCDRSPENWSQHMQTRFYVYPVHPSGSFVQTETLASALYLVLLRLLNRDYVSAAPLISTCHTDQKFSVEERWIMSLVNTIENDSQDKLDAHPDAHACRLMLALVCLSCGEKVPWDYAADFDGYIKKNSHISQVCRLSIADERLLMSSLQRAGGIRGQFLAAVERRQRMDLQRAKQQTDDSVDALGIVEYECTADVGVAWRNSKNVQDRFELVAGPSSGALVWPLCSPQDDWLAVNVPGYGTKYLPIRYEGVGTLFQPIETSEVAEKRRSEEQETRYKAAQELLFTGFEHATCMDALEMNKDSLEAATSWLVDRMGKYDKTMRELADWRKRDESARAARAKKKGGSADDVVLSNPGKPAKNGGELVTGFKQRTCKPIFAQLMAGDELKFRYTYFYSRPHEKGGRLVGPAALKVCENLWSEDAKSRLGMFVGRQSKTGMALLYEMLMGQVDLVLVENMDEILREAKRNGIAIVIEEATNLGQGESKSSSPQEDFSQHTEAATELNAVVPQFSVDDLCVLLSMHNGDADAALGAVFVNEDAVRVGIEKRRNPDSRPSSGGAPAGTGAGGGGISKHEVGASQSDETKMSPAVQNLCAIFPDYSAIELAMILEMKQNSMEETAHVIAISDSKAELVARAEKYKKEQGSASGGSMVLQDGDESPRRSPKNSFALAELLVHGLLMKCTCDERSNKGPGSSPPSQSDMYGFAALMVLSVAARAVRSSVVCVLRLVF
jgi:hypothetical protein